MMDYTKQSIFECSRENGFDWDYYQYLCDIQPDEPDWDNDAGYDFDYPEDYPVPHHVPGKTLKGSPPSGA